MKVGAKVAFPVIGLNLLFAVFMLAVTFYASGKYLGEYFVAQDSSKTKSALYFLDSEGQRCVDGLEWMSESARLIKAVAANDTVAVDTLAQTAQKSLHFTYFLVTDKQGNILSDPDNIFDQGNVVERTEIKSALAGQKKSGIVTVNNIMLLAASTPLIDETGAVIGTVSMGLRMDQPRFVDNIKNLVAAEVTVFNGDTRLMTSLKDAQGARIVGTRLDNQTILTQVLAQGQTFKGDSVVQGRDFGAVYTPLKSVDGEIIGMIFTGQDKSVIGRLTDAIMLLQLMATVIFIALVVVLIVIIIKRAVTQPLKIFSDGLALAADGDLRISFDETRKDELGAMGAMFNHFMMSMQKLLKEISTSSSTIRSSSNDMAAASNEVGKAADEVAQSVTHLAQGAQEQTESVNVATNALTDIDRQIAAIMQAAADSLDSVKTSKGAVEKGTASVQYQAQTLAVSRKTIADINGIVENLQEKSESINGIVEVIDSIAGQTNLLALNAAIEAARAGEAGRGFAVVADEIRKLAEGSTASTAQITQIIAQIREAVEAAVAGMHGAAASFDEQQQASEDVSASFDSIDSAFGSIHAKSEVLQKSAKLLSDNALTMVEQMKSIAEVSEENSATAEQVSAATEEQTASIEETAAAASHLAELAVRMQDNVEKFTIE